MLNAKKHVPAITSTSPKIGFDPPKLPKRVSFKSGKCQTKAIYFLSFLFVFLPPPPTPESESSTKHRPETHRAAPKNCHLEYFVPRKSQVRSMTQTTVQQSSKVTLVIEENWYALLTVINTQNVVTKLFQ